MYRFEVEEFEDLHNWSHRRVLPAQEGRLSIGKCHGVNDPRVHVGLEQESCHQAAQEEDKAQPAEA